MLSESGVSYQRTPGLWELDSGWEFNDRFWHDSTEIGRAENVCSARVV